MRPTDIFRKLMDKVYHQTVFTRHRKDSEVGALVKKLSPEDRHVLSELKSDDLSENKIIMEEVKIFAYDEYNERHDNEIALRNEKSKFDKLILKQ